MPSRPSVPSNALGFPRIPARAFLAFGVLALTGGALACSPQVGDPCKDAADCSQVGDLLCDTTQPGGYCTQFNCEPGGCDDDSLCIAFRARESFELACDNPQIPSRFERTFCMATCSNDGDCRGSEGYACEDMNIPDNLYGAVVVEENDANGMVCVQPYSLSEAAQEELDQRINETDNTEVCTGAGE